MIYHVLTTRNAISNVHNSSSNGSQSIAMLLYQRGRRVPLTGGHLPVFRSKLHLTAAESAAFFPADGWMCEGKLLHNYTLIMLTLIEMLYTIIKYACIERKIDS